MREKVSKNLSIAYNFKSIQPLETNALKSYTGVLYIYERKALLH